MCSDIFSLIPGLEVPSDLYLMVLAAISDCRVLSLLLQESWYSCPHQQVGCPQVEFGKVVNYFPILLVYYSRIVSWRPRSSVMTEEVIVVLKYCDFSIDKLTDFFFLLFSWVCIYLMCMCFFFNYSIIKV